MTVSSTWYYRSASLTAAQAFDQFRRESVDLNPEEVDKARRSRNYLKDQLVQLSRKNTDFPRITGEIVGFGSFARSTKVRPLDDIDLLMLLDGSYTKEIQSWQGLYTYQVQITSQMSPLWSYADYQGNVSSIRVLNRIRDILQKTAAYGQSETVRNQEAVILNLRSYDWSFDIVPAVPILDWSGKTIHYLIPNGSGNWKRTDPRRDQTAITGANQAHNRNLIPLIRLIKYWNEYSRSAPKLSSYHLETMLISGLHYHYPPISANLRASIPLAFRTLAERVIYACPDPKQLGPNLDEGLSWDTRQKVQEAANMRARYAEYALTHEQKGEYKEAIEWWGYVFPNFPKGG